MKIWWGILWVFVSLISIDRSVRAQSEPDDHDAVPFITPQDELAGKWLVTMAIGKGVPPAFALELRDVLISNFAVKQGGFYRVAIDLDDSSRGGEIPTVAEFRAAFDKLKSDIDKFKRAYPKAPRMLMMGLTGHGGSPDGEEYSFSLADGRISGKELIQLLTSLDVDEMVLIMQSCESGPLTSHIAPAILKPLEEKMREQGKRLAVLVPVSGTTSSPVSTWEEVLKEAFENLQSDMNSDGVITWGEMKRAILAASILRKEYLPGLVARFRERFRLGGLHSVGIDPQFFEVNFPDETPMLLTAKGVEAYKNGSLQLPQKDSSGQKTKLPPIARDQDPVVHKTLSILDLALRAAREKFASNPAKLEEIAAEETRIRALLLGGGDCGSSLAGL